MRSQLTCKKVTTQKNKLTAIETKAGCHFRFVGGSKVEQRGLRKAVEGEGWRFEVPARASVGPGSRLRLA